jgi:hypothetical protein
VQVSACVLASGALRQWHVRLPSGELPSAQMLGYMELDSSDYAQALEHAQFANVWDAFLQLAGPSPIVAAWNQSTLDLLVDARARVCEPLVLKSAYRGRCGVEITHLEDIVGKLGLPAQPNALRGRAAFRLACAAAVGAYLHGLAAEPELNADAAVGALAAAQNCIG